MSVDQHERLSKLVDENPLTQSTIQTHAAPEDESILVSAAQYSTFLAPNLSSSGQLL